MQMKTIKYIVGILIISFTSSCSDDFLDRFPKDEESDATYWKKPLDAEMFVADLYRYLPGGGSGDIDGDINSDNAVHGIKWAAGNVSKGIYDPADHGWSGEYEAIRKANFLLEKIYLIPNYPEKDKEITMAEARFFRATKYFELIRKFGDVPYFESSLDLGDLESVLRTSWKNIYQKVMEDFDYAIKYLPLQWSADKYGRVTKGAANAMKARAALYFGDKVEDGWKTAADAAWNVIESGQYELLDKDNTEGIYKELFWEKQEACSEAVLVRRFTKGSGVDNYILGWGSFPTKGWGGINPTQSLVDAFECIDGGSIDQSPKYIDKTPFENRDPRLEVCVLHDGEERYGITIKVAPIKASGNTGIGQHGDATSTGYYNDKYLDPNMDPNVDFWDGGKDWHVIRFAEVLLTYAEAKNKISPLDNSALEAVNRVRKRVGMPDLQKTDPSKFTFVSSGDDLDKRIRNEWRVEFALEGGKRQWDIRRWGIAKDVMNKTFKGMKMTENKDGSFTLWEGENILVPGYGGYEDHNYLYPIPQAQRDLNPALTQNPGYAGSK